MSIDPGSEGTGWALWEEDLWTICSHPAETGIIRGSSSPDWLVRTRLICDRLAVILLRTKPHTVYLEMPALHESFGGQTTARSGALVKLCMTAGAICSVCWQAGYRVILVPVASWKGQMKKELVAKRIAKRLDCAIDKYPSHSNDAVGIGLHAKGFFHLDYDPDED